MIKYYTGVGSRETPDSILNLMKMISKRLETEGFILRTGDAQGADKSFRDGVIEANNKEIYVAKDSKQSDYYITEKIHPAWHNCSEFAKKLHTRNLYQVKGIDLDLRSEFLLCWTKDGKDVGGTRTAIIFARQNEIPVFNLAKKEDLIEFISFVKENFNISLL